MKQARITVFRGTNLPVELKTIQIPDLQAGEILVQNEYCTLCRSDLKTFSGQRIEPTPTILGHEIVGRILAFGPKSWKKDCSGKSLEVGDRITWAIFASDPNHEISKAGIPQKAPDLFKYGHQKITNSSTLHGGLASHILLRKNTPIIKVSESIPLKVTAIINCAVATVAGAIRIAGALEGKRVLVSGAGMLGMIASAMSKVANADQVIAVDKNQERLLFAKSFGADLQLLPEHIQEIGKVDVIIELSGAPNAMETTLKRLKIGGTAIWVGATFPQRDLNINAEFMIRNLLSIRGLHNYNQQDLIEAVNFMENYHDHFPFEDLVYDDFDLDEVQKAFVFAIEKNPFRVGVRL